MTRDPTLGREGSRVTQSLRMGVDQHSTSLTCNDLESILQLLTQVEIQNISKYNLCEIKERGFLFWKRNQKKIER